MQQLRSILRVLSVVVVVVLGCRGVDAQSKVVLSAVDSKSISDVSQFNLNDNRLRAYYRDPNQGFLDGFLKFDLSQIPDNVSVLSMKLVTYHEEGFNNPKGNPKVRIYRVAEDGWTRNAQDLHPGLQQALSAEQSGFPASSMVPVEWDLNVAAVNWTADLNDNTLSLAMRNEAGQQGRYSYVYFHGADTVPAPPELYIEYADSFTLQASGPCPGRITVTASGETFGGQIAYVYGTPGNYIQGGYPCSGLALPMDNPTIAQITTQTSVWQHVPATACGVVRLIAVDLATCRVSNPVDL